MVTFKRTLIFTFFAVGIFVIYISVLNSGKPPKFEGSNATVKKLIWQFNKAGGRLVSSVQLSRIVFLQQFNLQRF